MQHNTDASETTSASFPGSYLKPHQNPSHRRQKTPVKIYNSNFNKFDYEVSTKQKNNYISEFNAMHTPSNISTQSLVIHNDIYYIIPVVREMISQAECKDENFITRQEAFHLLRKLRIVSSYGSPNTSFRALAFTHDSMKIEDFFMFFATELVMLDMQKCTKEELILKFGTEIFRAVGKEDTELEIMDVVQYLKDHKNLGFDLTQLFELFDFYKSEISGTLKNKLSINAFFNKVSPMLHQVFIGEFVEKMKNIAISIKQDPLRSQHLPNPSAIKFYDPEKGRVVRQNLTKKLAEDTENIYTGINSHTLRQDTKEHELEDYFYEVHPKNKGWLMRRSRKHNNKWAMVFCEINEGRFLSAQPTTLKKSIEIKYIEMHKCNFLEIMSRFDFSQSADLKRGHRRTGSQGYKLDKVASADKPRPEKTPPKLEFCFFILDRKNQKTYLVRSPDNLIIGSIIHFYLHREKYTHLNELFSPSFTFEPEFSGVIEIAMCTKKSIGKFHSNLKSYAFRKQFLIMKNGKFNIYDMKVKDNVSLSEFEVKREDQLDILPQTNPYVFTLEKSENQKFMQEGFINEVDEDVNIQSHHQQTNMRKTMEPNHVGHDRQNDQNAEPYYADLVFVEEKKQTRSFIHNFFRSLVTPKKKTEKITLACDTETKRRQWILTLNYFIMNHLRVNNRTKIFTTKDSFLNTHEDVNLRSSFQNEQHTDSNPNSGTVEKKKKKNKPSISFKNTLQENSDFYDVYDSKDNQSNSNQLQDFSPTNQSFQKSIDSKLVQKTEGTPSHRIKPSAIQTEKSNNLPLITEPDINNPLDSEEILLTFTQFNAENLPAFLKNNPNSNHHLNIDDPVYLFPKEIKTLSDVELWQKFLIYFIKESHVCSHFDMHEEAQTSSTIQANSIIDPTQRNRSSIDSSRHELENIDDEEPLVKRVLTNWYNDNKT